MISYIKGTVETIDSDNIIIENNGIGYCVFVPFSVIEVLQGVGSEVKIHTYLHVKEDAMQLFGFATRDDLNVFKLLITVSGIGPKGALNILSTLSSDDLRFAVMADDSKAISKAPGIGAKTAQRLIIELKDKLKLEDVIYKQSATGTTSEASIVNAVTNEAVQVLIALGYSKGDSVNAVKKVPSDIDNVDDVISYVLKFVF